MPTPREILDAAFSHNHKLVPESIIDVETEGNEIVHRALTGLILLGSRANPDFFAGQALAVSFDGTGWPRPANASLVYWITKTGSTDRVWTVDIDDQEAAFGRPAVYLLGRTYYAVLNNPATSEQLDFTFARVPAKATDVDAEIDSLWPDAFDELLALEVAIYLNLKDGRDDEAASLIPSRDAWAMRLLAFLEHETVGKQRRWTRRLGYMIPPQQLLAGGSSLRG